MSSTPSSRLSSLLKYRFVRKDTNGSQSSGSYSQSTSQSTADCKTPDKKTPSLQITPDGKTSLAGSFISSPGPLSPESPVFSSRPKLIDRVYDVTPEKSPSSSGPWLSKQNGQISHGKGKSVQRQWPRIEDSSDDDDVVMIEDMDNKMASLRSMFPAKTTLELKEALNEVSGDVEKAIDILIQPQSKKRKRIRTESDLPHEKTMKRIRQISSDSDVGDSQGTMTYNLESQRSDATVIYDVNDVNGETLTDDQQRKMKYVMENFQKIPEKTVREALESNNWHVGDAFAKLKVIQSTRTAVNKLSSQSSVQIDTQTKQQTKKMVMMDSDVDVDDDDEEAFSGGEESDDSIEEEGDSGKNVILSFFEEATLEEIMATPGCSKKKAELILSLRPFNSWSTLVEKFITVKGLTYDIVIGCREFIRVRDAVVKLMKKCESISGIMQSAVYDLLHSKYSTDSSTRITTQPKSLNPEQQLKPFQMVGLNWLKIMHNQELNGILADEMGLGKTVQTISFLAHLMEEGETGPHVIIVPSSTIENWIRECKVWCPTMKVLVYYGSQEDRRATRRFILYNTDETYNVMITTYNMATGSNEDRALFKKFEFHYAVFDEGHLLKNMSSQRYQCLMRISAHRRLLLTGTPLQNNLLELMSLLCFVMPDMFIGKTEQLKRIFSSISRGSNDEKRSSYEEERIKHAKQILKPFILRRLKSEVLNQLPQKKEKIIYCTMTPDQQELYDKIINKITDDITDSNDDTNRSAMLMQLRKAANHPLLHRHIYDDITIHKMAEALCKEPSHKDRGALPKFVAEDMMVMSDFELHNCCKLYGKYLKSYLLDETRVNDSGKFRELDVLLEEHRNQGDRMLLFSQFTSVLDIMEVYLKMKSIRYLRLDGSTAVPERQRLIDQYNNDKEIYIFLLSTKAGGLGINLTSANVVVLHDIDFNPYNDKQAEDRCHRVGQTKEVHIVRLICKETVDEAMLKCSQDKLKLERDVISSNVQEDGQGSTKDLASILKQALAVQHGKS